MTLGFNQKRTTETFMELRVGGPSHTVSATIENVLATIEETVELREKVLQWADEQNTLSLTAQVERLTRERDELALKNDTNAKARTLLANDIVGISNGKKPITANGHAVWEKLETLRTQVDAMWLVVELARLAATKPANVEAAGALRALAIAVERMDTPADLPPALEHPANKVARKAERALTAEDIERETTSCPHPDCVLVLDHAGKHALGADDRLVKMMASIEKGPDGRVTCVLDGQRIDLGAAKPTPPPTKLALDKIAALVLGTLDRHPYALDTVVERVRAMCEEVGAVRALDVWTEAPQSRRRVTWTTLHTFEAVERDHVLYSAPTRLALARAMGLVPGGVEVSAIAGYWVAVADGLPEMHEMVLLWPKHGMGQRTEKFCRATHEFADGWEWESDGEGFTVEHVTHWARVLPPESSDAEETP